MTQNPCPEGWETGVAILKDRIYGPSSTLNIKAISKVWLDVFGLVMGVDGGLFALQSLLTIKKASNHLNFQLNKPFLKFLWQLFLYEAPWSKTKKQKNKSYIVSTSFFI